MPQFLVFIAVFLEYNEGKCLVIVREDKAAKALDIMHSTREGEEAAIIGRLIAGKSGRVSEPLPRIC